MTKIGSFTLPTATIVKGTIRYRLRISRGGDQIRLRFSNEFGDDALVLTAASVGLAGEGLNALAGSLKRITFGGQTSITVPAGAPVLSDPILLPVKALEDLVVSVYAGGGTSVFACNPIFSFPNQAVVDGSDTTDSAEQQASPCMETIRPIVSEIDVRSDHPRNVVVAFGDSITDGRVNMKTGERGWPGVLSRRLEDSGISVINAGIGGNRLLLPLPIFGVSALARFDRDVLSVPGVSHIVLLEGVNDIGMSGPGGMFGDTPVVEPQPLIDAYLQIIARAHERGIKVVGGTLLPFAGANYYSEDKEKVRTAINRWIRTSKSFDGIVDFDAAMRNPNDPTRLKADYDSGDHLHPNDEGYRHLFTR
jgi:lysophospholipase L1-like esterase